MDYLKVTVTVERGDVELLCSRLGDVAAGFEIDDPAVIDDFVNDKNSRWDYIEEGLYDNPERAPSVSFYLEDGESGALALEQARSIVAGLEGDYRLAVERVRSDDWENNWKQYYKPFKVGARLYVRPSWETIADDEGRTVLVMDPASSFGTGSHATTRLCMEQLDALELAGKNVLDMGCGSGILGCCAMLLGARRLFYCDIDENAVRIAGENLAVNAIDASLCTPLCADVIVDRRARERVAAAGPFDVILANIVSDVLKAMSGFFRDWLAPGGTLILSGIIDERAAEVREHFERGGFAVDAALSCDGWTMYAVSLRK